MVSMLRRAKAHLRRKHQMTNREINTRIEHYNEVLRAGKITAHEWEAFMQALCRLAQKR